MGTMNNCLFCNCKTENPKYCSRSCSAKHTNILYPKRKTKKTCSICDEPVINYRVSHCGKHHNEYLETRFDFIKNLTLADYWDKKSLKELHSSSKNVHIRNLCRSWLKHLRKLPCFNCGYYKHVELCHIKPIHSFSETSTLGEINSENNVVQLCPNCHWEFDNGFLDIIK